MKKSLKILLTMVVVVLLFSLTAVVSSAATTASNQQMDTIDIFTHDFPMHELSGLPENADVYEIANDGQYTILYGCVEEEVYDEAFDLTYWDTKYFLGASINGTEFECFYAENIIAQTNLANLEDAYVDLSGLPVYENGYYYFEAEYYDEAEGYVDCYVRTTDFVTWESVTDGVNAVDEVEYLAYYNGYYIFHAEPYDAGNGKCEVAYYMSKDTNPDNWYSTRTMKMTPAFSTPVPESASMDTIIYDCNITETPNGLIFELIYIQNTDDLTVTTEFSEYYITKDFETYEKLDLSVLGDCKGGIENSMVAYDDTIALQVAVDGSVFAIRKYDKLEYDSEYDFYDITENTTEIYILDEEINKFALDCSFNDSYGLVALLMTGETYYVESLNLDFTSTIYKRNGDSLAKIEDEYMYMILGEYYCAVKSVYNNVVDIDYFAGVYDNHALFLTNNDFKTNFIVYTPDDYLYFLGHSYDGTQMYICIENEIDEENCEYKYYLINIDEFYDYVGPMIYEPTVDNFTGLFKHCGTWYYAENGEVDFDYTGLVKHIDGNWYYVVDGIVDYDYTGLVKHTNGIWYYIENGILDWSYSGLWKHTNNIWYYIQKGRINWSFTGLIRNTDGTWYYIQGARPDWDYTGLVKHTTGSWFYVQEGKINFDYTGLVKHTNNIWYYIENGKLDWGHSGLWKHNGAWYYVQKGRINWSFTGLVKHTNGTWYYVERARLNWDYTGLVKHTTGSWFYVEEGEIDFDYTGLVKHTNGKWYYVQKGKLNWNYTGYTYYNGKKYKVVKGVKV